MTQEKEVIKVDINNYSRFWEMLNSPDKENSVVAMSILNQVEFRESLPYILLLLKEKDSAAKKTLLDNATDLKSKLVSINITENEKLTYKKIIEIIKDKCPVEAYQFVVDQFSIPLKNYIVQWGYDFVADLDFKLIVRETTGKTV